MRLHLIFTLGWSYSVEMSSRVNWQAVQFSILATPSAAVELRRSYDHTRRILEEHAYGVAMLSAMGRAKLELWLERGQIAPRLRRIVLRHTL